MRASRAGTLPTLRDRMSRLALGVIAAWIVVLAAGFDLVLLTRLDHQLDDTLRVRAQAASATIDRNGDTIVGVRESSTDSELDSSIWVFGGGRLIERPTASGDLIQVATDLATGSSGYADGDGHRFYVLPIESGSRRIGAILASVDLDPHERTQDTVLIGSALVTVLLVAGAYPALRLATGRALRPVEGMTQQAAEWSVTSPDERFGSEQQYQELSTLAGSLDEMLDRLAAVLRHERHLSAELSHELRTPLARVVAQVDLVLESARPDQTDELLAIRANCDRMDAIIESLLAAARSELTGTVGRSDLATVFHELAQQQAKPAVTIESTRLAVGVEREVLERALAPILENARRHARSEVHLRALRDGNAVRLEITNDGPRLDPDIAEHVFEPGFRGRGSDSGHDGAGLGLPLSRRIARSADGDVTVDLRAARTTFVLTLPAG